jgi:CRISPR/Cas system CSM-associated protein Csm2 small subunit
LLKLHCIEIAKPELFEELEKQCKNIVLNKIYEYNRNLEESRVRSKTAEAVIERIKYFFAYAQHKQSLKMRFTLKEYEHAISLIDDVEKKKVEKWLDDNGGFDKYVLSGYTLS